MGCAASTPAAANQEKPDLDVKPPKPEQTVVSGKPDAPAAAASESTPAAPPLAEGQLYDFEKLTTDNFLNLPRLPIPPLEATIASYLKCVTALECSPEEMSAHTKLVEEFKNGVGKELHEMVVAGDKHEGYPYTYIQETWDKMYKGLRCTAPVNVSPFFGLQDRPGTQTMRAAQFVHSFTKWTRKLRDGKLEADGKGKMCSSAFKPIFASAKCPHEGMDTLVQYPDATNIVVLAKGNLFSVEVVTPNGEVLDAVCIERQLAKCVSAPAASHNIPILTSEDRDKWAAAHKTLLADMHNMELMEKVDRGIIVVCLDDAPMPTLQSKAECLLIGPGDNRWWDKQQLVVGCDGHMGLTFEHSYSDGTIWGRFINEVMCDIEGKPSGVSALDMPSASCSITEAKCEELKFTLDKTVLDAIEAARVHYAALCANVEQKATQFTSFGKNMFKTWGTSPDAAVQMAYQMAFHKLHGKVAPTYEAAAMRSFFQGRTETIRSATPESLALCQAYAAGAQGEELTAKYKAACANHSAVTKAGLTGKGVDRIFTAMQKMAEKKGGDIPALFTDKIFTNSKNWLLSTSNGSAPWIDLFGFGAVSGDGYGIGYLINNNDISFNISAYNDAPSTSAAKLTECLTETLTALKDAFEPAPIADADASVVDPSVVAAKKMDGAVAQAAALAGAPH